MQKWEYLWATVFNRQFKTEIVREEQGLFGTKKEKDYETEYKWSVRYKAEFVPLQESLDRCGEDGWELVGAVIESEYHSGVQVYYKDAPHHLYFKRPKP